MIWRQSSRSTSSQGMKGTIAALLTSTSTLPNRSSVASTMRLDVAGIGDVRPRPPSPSPVSAVGRRLRSLLVDVGDDDRRALLGELLGDRPADPLGAAGHDRDPILQLHPFLLAPVAVGSVLVVLERLHVVREEQLGVVLAHQPLDAPDRAHAGDRVDVEAGLLVVRRTRPACTTRRP